MGDRSGPSRANRANGIRGEVLNGHERSDPDGRRRWVPARRTGRSAGRGERRHGLGQEGVTVLGGVLVVGDHGDARPTAPGHELAAGGALRWRRTPGFGAGAGDRCGPSQGSPRSLKAGRCTSTTLRLSRSMPGRSPLGHSDQEADQAGVSKETFVARWAIPTSFSHAGSRLTMRGRRHGRPWKVTIPSCGWLP